jgi:hypothetical protein
LVLRLVERLIEPMQGNRKHGGVDVEIGKGLDVG